MRDLLKGVDQAIRDAQEAGKFDDLRGKGKPLVLDMSPDAVVNGLLKEANVTPEWIELARQIERLEEESERLLESFAAVHEAGRSALMGDVSGRERAIERTCGAVPRADARAPARTEPRWQFGWRALAARLARSVVDAPAAETGREAALAEFHRRWEITLARYAALLHQINRKRRRFNQIVPLADRQRLPVPVAERLESFVERFPILARDEAGMLQPVRGIIPESLLAPPLEEESAVYKRDLRQAAAIHGMRQIGRRPPPIG
jgi:Domain of unknown function (DUF1992)